MADSFVQLDSRKHVGISFELDAGDVVATVTPESVGAAPVLHGHEINQIRNLQQALDSKQDKGGDPDSRYLRVDDAQELSGVARATGRTNLGLGTSATLNVPSVGDAGPTEVVLGNDSRLASGGGGGGGTAEVNLGDMTGLVTVNLSNNKTVNAYGTLVGDAELAMAGVEPAGVTIVTLAVTQDATGGRKLTFPPGTVFLNGSNGSIGASAGAVTWVTLARSGGVWSVAISDARPNEYDPFYWNVPGNGMYYLTFSGATTLDFGGVVQRGTGMVAHAKSTDGTTFTPASGVVPFATGDVWRGTVTGFSNWFTFVVPRLA